MEKIVIRDCTLILGDCLEMLETIPPGSISCCWTDPPYGIGFQGNHRKLMEKQEMLANDERPHLEFVPPIVRAVKDGGAIYLCTRFDVAAPWVDALTDAGAKVKNPIFWIKDTNGTGRKFIGAEIHGPYFDLACERIEAAYRKVDSRLPGFEPVAMEQGSLFD